MGGVTVPVRVFPNKDENTACIEIEMLADTGATYTVLPRAAADQLGLVAIRKGGVVLAGGQRAEWPMTYVRLEVMGRRITAACWIAPGGRASLA